MAAVATSSLSLVASPVCRLGDKTSIRRTAAPAKMVSNRTRLVMSAEKENKFSVQRLVTPTSVALLAAAVLPEIAEAAQPGISPSLKNLLLSVLAGGVVLGGIGIAVAGVSTFDPVKRK